MEKQDLIVKNYEPKNCGECKFKEYDENCWKLNFCGRKSIIMVVKNDELHKDCPLYSDKTAKS